MRFTPCVLLPSSLMCIMISNISNCEFVQLALYICVIIAMFLLGSFIYGDRLLNEFADQPIVPFLFPFLLLTYLWSINRGSQVKRVTTGPTKPKPKPLKESGLNSLSHSPPPVKRKQKKKRMSAVKENLDPKMDGCKAKMVPVLGPYLDLVNHPQFEGKDLYEEFTKFLLTPEQLSQYDYPIENPDNPGHIFTRMKTYNPSPTSRICSRCGKTFTIENGKYHSDTNCFFHSERKDKNDRYGCCGKPASEMGCKLGISHVNPALPLDDLIFKKTELKKQVKADQLRKIFSLDCEMVYTTLGFEVAKVTLVDVQGKPVYNTFVLPQHKVTDYNTMYSGIRKRDLQDVKITLDDVQAFLLKNITKDTILVGHALQNDLKCLRIIHDKVVDTQVVFRNPGDNRRKKLKTLASDYLNISIQDGKSGHCSLQDSRACMELMLKKIYDSLDVTLIKELKESDPCTPRNILDKEVIRPGRIDSPFHSSNPVTERPKSTNAFVAPNSSSPMFLPHLILNPSRNHFILTYGGKPYGVKN